MIVNKLVDSLGITGTNYKNKEYILQTSTTFSFAQCTIEQFKNYIQKVIHESNIHNITFTTTNKQFQLQKKKFQTENIEILNLFDTPLEQAELSILSDLNWIKPGGYLYKYVFVPLPDKQCCNVYFIVHHSIMDGLGIFNLLNRLYLQTENISYIPTDDDNQYRSFEDNPFTRDFWEEKKEKFEVLLHPKNVEKLQTIELNFSMSEKEILKKKNLSVLTIMALTRTYPIFFPEEYKKFAIDMALNVRKKEEWGNLGMYVNIVPLFFDNWEELPVNKFERLIKLGIVQSFKHRSYEVNQLGESYANLLFSYLPLKDIIHPNLTDTLAINWLDTNCGPYDFSFTLFEKRDEISLRLDYKKQNFIKEEMEAFLKLVKEYILLFSQLSAEMKKEITVMKCMTPIFIQDPIQQFFPKKENFTQQIEKVFYENGSRIAIKDQEHQITFNQLAHNIVSYTQFIERQYVLEEIDAFFIEGTPCLQSFTMMLTAISLGKPYVFINRNLASDSLNQLEKLFEHALWFSNEAANDSRQSLPFPDLTFSKRDSYLLHFNEAEQDLLTYFCTSGTTGQPKIIPVKRSSVYNLICNDDNLFMSPHSVSLLVASVTFDLTIDPIYRTFLNSGTLVLVNQNRLFDTCYLAKLIDTSQADTLLATPSVLAELADDIYLRLKRIGGVGESFLLSLADRLLGFSNLSVFNCYGPTEATCYSHVFPLVKGKLDLELGSVPIGVEIDRMDTVIIDPFNSRLPKYLKGEILLKGAGVFDGYHKYQGTEDIFQLVNGEVFYRTGDVGYFDGENYHYTKRKGNQIKLNGYRIELNAIEAVLQKYFKKKYKIVVIDSFIVLFYEEEIQEKKLVQQISKKLPPYMVPRNFIKLPFLPMNKNQKIDIKELHTFFKSYRCQDSIEEMSETEREVFGAFSKVLGMTNFSKKEKLYQLGGDSLMAIQISNILKKSFFEIEFNTVMKEQSIENISSFIERKRQINKNEYEYVFDKTRKDQYSPSNMQRSMILKNIIKKDDTSYIIGTLISLTNQTIDIEKIKDILTVKKDLHFKPIYKDQKFLMVYNPDFKVDYTELTVESVVEIKKSIRPLNVFRDSLIRITKIYLKGEAKFLLFEMHHLIADGQTIVQLLKELSLPMIQSNSCNVPISEAMDYIAYKREILSERIVSSQLDTLSGSCPSVIKTTKTQETRTIQMSFDFNNICKKKIDQFKKKKAISTQAIFSVWIIRYLKNKKIINSYNSYIVGTPVSLRDRIELESTLGPLIQMIPYVTSALGYDLDFSNTQDSLTDAVALKYVSYDEWVEKLGTELFQIIITSFYDYQQVSDMRINDSINLYDEKFGCSFYIYEKKDSIRIVVSTNIFEEQELNQLYKSLKKEIDYI